MKGRCTAITRFGTRCQKPADAPNGLCWTHSPEHAAERRRMASRAGSSKPSREIRDLKSLCRELAEKVLTGEQQPGPAAVANQLYNTVLRAVEVERRLREGEELEARISALEQASEQTRGGARRWGT